MTTKAELNALEKVFEAEINDRLPFQSKAKIFQSLCDNGYLEPMKREFAPDRFGAIIVTGYQLSHLGRLTYCMSCDDNLRVTEERYTNFAAHFPVRAGQSKD